MIAFNKSLDIEKGYKYIDEAIKKRKISGDGEFTKKCNSWFEENYHCKKALLTTSCTHALEMAAILIDTKQDDEIISPSYTFVSTVNAFVLRGAKIKFIDIERDTMNIDADKIEKAITDKTKAIVVVHYAGVSCNMDEIMNIARKHNIYVIEDAAQGVHATYKDKFLGTIGDIGCYSFHDTKNYTMGEGGAIIINNEKFIERAEIIREKGTDRTKFFRGEVDKYTWVDIGSSYLPSDINAAYLYGQLEIVDEINKNRLDTWNNYYKNLKNIKEIELPTIPEYAVHNGHMFYIKLDSHKIRNDIMNYLRENGIYSVFHYIPLHSAKAGENYGEFIGEDRYTTVESEKLLRLPMYYGLEKEDVIYICNKIREYFKI